MQLVLSNLYKDTVNIALVDALGLNNDVVANNNHRVKITAHTMVQNGTHV